MRIIHGLLLIFIRYDDIEPRASDCTEIFVWHTMTFVPEAKVLAFTVSSESSDAGINVNRLITNMQRTGLAKFTQGKNDDRPVALPVCIGAECN